MQVINKPSSEVKTQASPAFNWTEEIELNCSGKDRLSYSVLTRDWPCSCDPSSDPMCYYCANSNRYYLLRRRQNISMLVFEPNRTLYVKDGRDAPYATVMGLKTTLQVQASSGDAVGARLWGDWRGQQQACEARVLNGWHGACAGPEWVECSGLERGLHH